MRVGRRHSRTVVYGEEKSFPPNGIRTSDRTAPNLITIPTILTLSKTKPTLVYARVIYFTTILLVHKLLHLFLGAFTKLRKATINFVMTLCPSAVCFLSVCPSVGMEQLSSHWTDFHGMS